MMQNKLIITVTIILECFLLPVPTLLTTECPEDVQEMVPTEHHPAHAKASRL